MAMSYRTLPEGRAPVDWAALALGDYPPPGSGQIVDEWASEEPTNMATVVVPPRAQIERAAYERLRSDSVQSRAAEASWAAERAAASSSTSSEFGGESAREPSEFESEDDDAADYYPPGYPAPAGRPRAASSSTGSEFGRPRATSSAAGSEFGSMEFEEPSLDDYTTEADAQTLSLSERRFGQIAAVMRDVPVVYSEPDGDSTLYNMLAYVAQLARQGFTASIDWLAGSAAKVAAAYDRLYFVGTLGNTLLKMYEWSVNKFIEANPNVVAATVSLMFGSAYSYIFGAWVGGIFWVDSVWLNRLHSLFTLGTGISAVGTALVPLGGLLVGKYMAPKLSDFMAEFGLGPYSTPESGDKAALDNKESSALKKVAGAVLGAVLLGVFVSGQLSMSFTGAQAMHSVYRTLFSWLNGGPFRAIFLLAMPEFCLLLTNLKRGNLREAVKAISTKIIIGNLIGFVAGGGRLPTTAQVLETVQTESGSTLNQLNEAVGAAGAQEAVKQVVTETWAKVAEPLASEPASGLNGIMGLFQSLFGGVVGVLGGSPLGICCAAILATIGIFRYYSSPKPSEPVDADNVVQCIEGLVSFQTLLVKHLDDMVNQRVPVLTNSQAELRRLRKLCPAVARHFDDEILVRLTLKDGAHSLGTKFFECANELSLLASRLDISSETREHLKDTLQASTNILLSKVTLIEAAAAPTN